MIFDACFGLGGTELWNEENVDYKKSVQLRFKKYHLQFENLFNEIDEQIKNQIIMGIRDRMYNEGLILEKITFEDWIEEILKIEE